MIVFVWHCCILNTNFAPNFLSKTLIDCCEEQDTIVCKCVLRFGCDGISIRWSDTIYAFGLFFLNARSFANCTMSSMGMLCANVLCFMGGFFWASMMSYSFLLSLHFDCQWRNLWGTIDSEMLLVPLPQHSQHIDFGSIDNVILLFVFSLFNWKKFLVVIFRYGVLSLGPLLVALAFFSCEIYFLHSIHVGSIMLPKRLFPYYSLHVIALYFLFIFVNGAFGYWYYSNSEYECAFICLKVYYRDWHFWVLNTTEAKCKWKKKCGWFYFSFNDLVTLLFLWWYFFSSLWVAHVGEVIGVFPNDMEWRCTSGSREDFEEKNLHLMQETLRASIQILAVVTGDISLEYYYFCLPV